MHPLPSPLSPAYGAELRALRKKARLSQHALAARSGVSQPYICKLETGERTNPTAEAAGSLASACLEAIEVGSAPPMVTRGRAPRERYGVGSERGKVAGQRRT